VAVGVDDEHRQAVGDGQVDRRLGVLGERLQERARDAAHVHLPERGEPQGEGLGAEPVLVERLGVAQVAELGEGVDQPGDGGLGEAGPPDQLLLGQPAVAGPEAAQHLEAARQRGDELPVGGRREAGGDGVLRHGLPASS
jgi:hypothetical protein